MQYLCAGELTVRVPEADLAQLCHFLGDERGEENSAACGEAPLLLLHYLRVSQTSQVMTGSGREEAHDNALHTRS